MSKFHVVWTEDGHEQAECYNSYYLATVRKGELARAGHKAEITENTKFVMAAEGTGVSYSNAEKNMIKKLKRTTSDKIREGNKKIYARTPGEPISREGLGRARRARALRLVGKGKLK